MLVLYPIISFSGSLTPANQPRNNSYYVCYQQRHTAQRSYRLVYTYDRFRYSGCVISRQKCQHRRKNRCYFGWFKTYYQAKNAFYRCAYSG